MGNLTAKTSGDIASFMSPSVTNIKSLKVYFSPKQLGTGDPSPENVREIEGWDGVEAYNDPKYSGFIVWNQLYNYGGSTGTNGSIKYTKLDNGTWEVKGTSNTTSGTAARRRQIQSPSWEANHVYWFSARAVGEGTQYLQMVLSNSGSIKATTTLYDGAFVKPTAKINQFSFRVYTQNVTVDAIARPQIVDLTKCFGETMANYIYNLEQTKDGAGIDYFLNLFPKDWYEYNAGELTTVSAVNNEPYTNLSINWSSDIGTVYGGYIDLISGELVEEYTYTEPNDNQWYINTNYAYQTGHPVGVTITKTTHKKNICNYWKNYTWDNKNFIIVNESGNLVIGKTVIEETFNGDYTADGIAEILANFKTNNLPLIITYPLKTPITHQLTPTQLKSFVGQNNFWSNADYVEIEYDLIETVDIQKTKQKIILNQPQLKTISDKVVSFNTDMVAPMKNCKIYFNPIQLGSGDASITNFRDIKGWTGVDAYVNGDKISVDWTSEVGTRYSGYIDLVKGELVIDWIYFLFSRSSKVSSSGITADGLRTWMTLRITHKVPPYQVTPENGDDYGLFSIGDWRNGAVAGRNRSYVNATYVYAVITDDTNDLTTAEGRTAFFDQLEASNIPIEVVYKRATPLRFQLTSQQLLTLKSTNHIWSETNGQQIDVTYWTRKNLTPTPLVNYLENQTWTDSAYISSSGKKTTNGTSASHFLTNQILLETGTYVLSGFSYYVGTDNTNFRIHAYDSSGNWLRQITFQQIDNLSPVDISFTLDIDTYINVSIAMDFDGVLAKIN